MSNTILGVRVTKEVRKLLEKVCKARGEDLSDFIRRAIRKELASFSFFSDETKKALGIHVECQDNPLKETEEGDVDE